MSPIARRLLRALRENAPAAAALGLALLLAGATLASVEARQTTTFRESVEESRWSEEARYAYVVPITRNATIWPENATLPMGEPVYYRTMSDHVPVAFSWNAPAVGEGRADARMVARVVAAYPDGRESWRIEHVLAEAATPDAARGFAIEGVLDLDLLVGQTKHTMDELPPGEARLSWLVETTVAYAVEGPAGPVAGKSVFVMPIQMQDPRFHLPGPDDLVFSRPHASVATRSTEIPVGWGEALASSRVAGLVVAGAALLGATVWAWRREARVAPEDLAWREEHEMHAEWITSCAGAIDPSSFPAPLVEVEDLGALVDAAADGRTRILFDSPRRVYYAVTAHVTYLYARHALR